MLFSIPNLCIQSLIFLSSNKIVIRSHLEIKGNVLLYFLQ